MTTVNPYINFEGNAATAMNYYRDCFGGELQLQTVGDSAIADKCEPAMQNQVMHSTITKNGVTLVVASDMTGRGGITRGNNFSLLVNCSSEAEINDFYSKFAAEGEVLDDLKEQFWGALFGVVKDKFGTRWMFNYDKNQQ